MILMCITEPESVTAMLMIFRGGPAYSNPAITVIDLSQETICMRNGANSASCQSITASHCPDISTWTAKDLQQAQEQDKDLCPVIVWLEKSTTKPCWEEVAPQSETTKAYWAQWESLKLCEGALYRPWENAVGDRITKQLVVPKQLRPSVLHLMHNLPTSGHMGVAKTAGRIKERFYWVSVHKDVQNWCKNCDLCASRRGPPKKIRAPLAQYNTGSPMERRQLMY